MKTYTLLLIAALALLPVVGALATPSTLITIPSTDVLPNATWHLDVDQYFTPSNKGGQATIQDIAPGYGFANGRAEVGLDYISPSAGDAPMFLSAKYKVVQAKGYTPAVVVGGFGFGTKSGQTDYDMLYAEGSEVLAPGARISLGYVHGNKTALGHDPDMIMAGLDGTFDHAQKWWYGVDYESGNNAFGALSAGVAYSITPKISYLIGWDHWNSSGTKDTVTTQLDVNF
jgi:hypothetical protein